MAFSTAVPHGRVHARTSGNGGAESSDDKIFHSNGASQNQVQGRSPISLTLTRTESLIKKIELALRQEEQQNNHQQLLSRPKPPLKMKACNLHAFSLKIGTWTCTSINKGDLSAKLYYRKKKLVWEFIFGSFKKKMEIRWCNVSAINASVDEDKHDRLDIELTQPPEYYNECKFERLKHTQWQTTDDFTKGHADCWRRHAILFSPNVLDKHFKNLLQYDKRLRNLSQQPFPTHNSPFFNTDMEYKYNEMVHRSSPVPLSNNDHQGTVQNVMQPTSSFVEQSGSELPMPGGEFPKINEDAREVSYVEERTNGVQEQSGNNQMEDLLMPPVREEDDHQLFEGLEQLIRDDELELLNVDNQRVAEVNTAQDYFKVDSTSKPLEHGHQINFNPFEAGTDGAISSGVVMNHHMETINDYILSFPGLQFDDGFAFQDLLNWLSSDNYMNGFDINGGNVELSGGSSTK